MKKKLKWIVIAVVLLLLVVIGGVWWKLDSIVRVAVERGTGRSLALKTDLGGANVHLFSGDVSLSDLKIANAEGFSQPNLLTLGGVSVDTSYSKVFGAPTAIDSINIDKPKLVIEFKGTSSNLKAVADNLAKTQTQSPAPQPSPNPPPSPQPQPNPTTGDANKPLKLIIDSLAVNGAQVQIVSDMLGVNQTIDIPAVHLAAIGNADGNRNGEEIGKVVSQVVTALTIEAQKSGKLPPQLSTILNGDLDGLINQIGGKFAEQATQLKAQAMQQVQQLQQQATEQIQTAKGKAQDQVNAATQKAQDAIQQQLGGILNGGGAKKDDKKKDK